MGACLSLGRAASAPCRHGGRSRGRSKRRGGKAKAPAAAAARADDKPSSAAVPPAHSATGAASSVHLGFPSGFAERFELGRELGRGQFARVYAARARAADDGNVAAAPHAAVAVKVIPKALLRAPGAADDIRREARARAAAFAFTQRASAAGN
jgi:hypothetical protein